MIETLKARREQLQKRGKKGFTLMEMLIVIAIIAILIAIAIPIFSAQLNNAKHAADEANARSMYAIMMADYMDNDTYDNTYTNASTSEKGGTATIGVKSGSGSTATTSNQNFEFSDISTITVTTGSAAPTVTLKSDGFDDVKFPAATS